jgi:ribosomal protein L14
MSVPSNKSVVNLVRVIQTRRCNTRCHARVSKFLKVVVRRCDFFIKPIAIKSYLYRIRVKSKRRALVIRSKSFFFKGGDLIVGFGQNDLVLLKRYMGVIGDIVFGPVSTNLKIKKFRFKFK